MIDGTLHGLVEEAAGREPAAIALADRRRRVSYGELIAMTGSVAAAIEERSGAPLVAVLAGAGIWTTVAALAVLRAGRGYVPLEPGLPADRLRQMVAELECDCMLVDESVEAGWFDGETVIVEAAAMAGRPVPSLTAAGPGDLAYVIFTSGSTGVPGAVGVEHGPAAAHVKMTAERLRLGPGDNVLQLHSTSFDSSIEEIWPTLAAGGRLVAPHDGILDIESILAQAAECGVTVMHMVTSYWRAVTQELNGGLALPPLPTLRQIETGGELMRLEDFEAWRACALGSVPLSNGYGPTEAVVTATLLPIEVGTEIPAEATSTPIGRALPGRRLYLRGESGELVARGEVGELQIGGELLARGYLNKPALTEERFVADETGPDGRVYRSGDLVRELVDGSLEFVGRVDDQVKVRGYRVELGEIASALRDLDGVREAAAVMLDAVTGRLGAAVVLDSLGGRLPSDLRGELEGRLPAYMVPPVIVELEDLPLSPTSGKVDRFALRQHLGERDQVA